MPRTARIAPGGVIFHVLNRANALGKPDSLVKPHPLIQALGRTRTQRHDRYQALIRAPIDADGLSDIRGTGVRSCNATIQENRNSVRGARILGSVGRAEETSAYPQLARSLIPLEWIYLVEFPEFSIQQRMRFL